MPSGVYVRKNSPSQGERIKCRKEYAKIYNKKYAQENRESIRTRVKMYRLLDPDKFREKERARDQIKEKIRRKKYNAENRPKINSYIRNRYKTDTQFRLECILRARLYASVSGKQKAGSAVRELGCTVEEFKNYIESLFSDGMTWENWAYKGWHIDHIKPLSLFDLEDREQFLLACHYTNMQPMWSMENHKKGNRI